MPISKIEISGYRGFRQKGTLQIATPDGRAGSGLTIITGPNNSGKSSILECMRARSGRDIASFSTGTRNYFVDQVEIKFEIDGQIEIIRSTQKGSSENIRENVLSHFKIFVVPSRRAFSPYFMRFKMGRDEYIGNIQSPTQRSTVIAQFESRLFNALSNQQAFNNVLYKILINKPQWTIDFSDQGQYYMKFIGNDFAHSSEGMGEGVVSLFAIVDALYDSRPGQCIVIDEPELSLHPLLQKRLSKVFSDYAKDRQIIISTHSPYFVDLESLSNGGKIARVTNDGNGTAINEISNAATDAIKTLVSGNIYNPHIFGLSARELFFQEDGIILTEGQEDVVLYPLVAEKIGAPISGAFFGWGAGGAGNIKHLCLLLTSLGFKSVAVLLDGDKIEECKKLEPQFPDYFFRCIPAKDIRTKSARAATPEIEGLLDKKLNINENLRVPTQQIFSELSKYMASI